MGRNFLGLIKNGYGEYWYYNGRIFYTEQEYDDLSTEQKEQVAVTKEKIIDEGQYFINKLNRKFNNINEKGTLSEGVLKKIADLINSARLKENKLCDILKIDNNLKAQKEKGDINRMKISIQKRDEEITQKLLKLNKYSDLCKILISKSFIDKLSKNTDILSFTVVGGGDIPKNGQDLGRRSKGKNMVNNLVKQILTAKNINTATKYMLQLLFGENKTEKEIESILANNMEKQILPILKNFLIDNLEVMSTTTGKITTAEKNVKPFVKRMGHLFYDYFQKNNSSLLTKESIEALRNGYLMPNGKDKYALKLDLSEGNDIYKINMRGVFYEINSEGREVKKRYKSEDILNTFTRIILETLQSLSKDQLNNSEWSSISESIKSVLLYDSNAWKDIGQYLKYSMDGALDAPDSKNWEVFSSSMWSKPQVSGLMGEIAGLILLNGAEIKVEYLAIALDDLKKQKHMDLRVISEGQYFGIQIKNYSSRKTNITLYEETEFNLNSPESYKYFDDNFMYCLNYLFINTDILNRLGVKIPDLNTFSSILMANVRSFLRIESLSDKEFTNETGQNNFFIINGKVISTSSILIQLYYEAQQILEAAKKDSLFEIKVVYPDTESIDSEASITDYKSMNNYWVGHKSIKTGGKYFPIHIQQNGGNNIVNNYLTTTVKFNGLKIKL